MAESSKKKTTIPSFRDKKLKNEKVTMITVYDFPRDFYDAGGVPALMNELNRYKKIDSNYLTVTGKSMGENISDRSIIDATVVHPVDHPINPKGGISVLVGNLAPEGSVVKSAAVAPEMMIHSGPATKGAVFQ